MVIYKINDHMVRGPCPTVNLLEKSSVSAEPQGVAKQTAKKKIEEMGIKCPKTMKDMQLQLARRSP